MNEDHDEIKQYGVHLNHCCVYSCKYGDDDCPVATGKTLPLYRCEDCHCLAMNPGGLIEAKRWWESLSAEQKYSIFAQNTQANNW